jgi:hypothetical protein
MRKQSTEDVGKLRFMNERTMYEQCGESSESKTM